MWPTGLFPFFAFYWDKFKINFQVPPYVPFDSPWLISFMVFVVDAQYPVVIKSGTSLLHCLHTTHRQGCLQGWHWHSHKAAHCWNNKDSHLVISTPGTRWQVYYYKVMCVWNRTAQIITFHRAKARSPRIKCYSISCWIVEKCAENYRKKSHKNWFSHTLVVWALCCTTYHSV